jgi:xylulokinase
VYDDKMYIAPCRHMLKGKWGAMAGVPGGGISMEWFRENLALNVKDGDSISAEKLGEIDEKASGLMEKAEKVMFYPYFTGSYYPDYNPDVRICLTGLGLENGRYEIARALMECVSFEAQSVIAKFREKGCGDSPLRLLGGASKSSLWSDIIANVTGSSVIRLKEADAACAGAAINAGVGCGLYRNYQEGYAALSTGGQQISLDSTKVEFYKNKYSRYMRGMDTAISFHSINKPGS